MRRTTIEAMLVCGALAIAMPSHGAERPVSAPADHTNSRQNLDLATVSKLLAEQASRLKDDAAARDMQLQALQGELQKNQNIDSLEKNIDQFVLLMRGAAERLAPAAEFRSVFTKLEATIRNYASRAESNLDPEVRKTSEYFGQRAADISSMMRSAEETRTHLLLHIDRLLAMRDRLRFNRSATLVDEITKGGQIYLDEMRTLAASAQRLANNLDNFGSATANP
jgi:hypothetical protein